MSTRLKLWGTAALLALMVGLILLYPELASHRHMTPAGLPPAFSGNRAEYGFALFSLFAMSSLALRKLIIVAVELRERDWRDEPDIGLYRMAIACLMLVIVLGAAPDVGLMLLWGEVEPATIRLAMMVDRIGDGLTVVPFLFSASLVVRAEQIETLPYRRVADYLSSPAISAHRRALYLIVPRREALVDHVRIVVSAVVIALGLALFK